MLQLDWNTKKVILLNTKLASSGRDTLHLQEDTLPLLTPYFSITNTSWQVGNIIFFYDTWEGWSRKKTCEDRSVWCHPSWRPNMGGAWNKNPPAFEVQNQATMLGYSGSGLKKEWCSWVSSFFLLVLQFGRKWGGYCCFKDRFRSIIRSYYRGAAGMLLVPDLALVCDVGNHWKNHQTFPQIIGGWRWPLRCTTSVSGFLRVWKIQSHWTFCWLIDWLMYPSDIGLLAFFFRSFNKKSHANFYRAEQGWTGMDSQIRPQPFSFQLLGVKNSRLLCFHGSVTWLEFLGQKLGWLFKNCE